MRNLAGVEDCDLEIEQELTMARINIVKLPAKVSSEVKFSLMGELNSWKFSRAWYYWVATEGRLPLEVARKLWQDPIGKKDVRCGGHCGCLSPDEYGATYLGENGIHLCSDPEGKEEKGWDRLVEKGLIHKEEPRPHFVQDKKAVYKTAYVDLYHIDSLAGLRLFADTIKDIK